jgi:hypothetical protein
MDSGEEGHFKSNRLGHEGWPVLDVRTISSQSFTMAETMKLERRFGATIAILAVTLLTVSLIAYDELPRGRNTTSILIPVSNAITTTQTAASISSASAITKTFQFGKMPANFTLNGYSFNILANGTGAFVGGSQYTEYIIAYQISDGTDTQTLVFGWEPPCSWNLGLPCKGDNSVIPPSPNPNGTAFGGRVDMIWFVNTSTIYLNVSTIQSTPSTGTTSVFTNPNNTINVTGLGLCSSNCIYPSPYAYATVAINAVVPISTLAVYVNNTYDSTPIRNPNTTTGFGNTMAPYAYLFKGSLPSQFVPAVKGAIYFFKFVATFQDGSTATAIASTIAD